MKVFQGNRYFSAILFYSICSSSMLLINKIALGFCPLPSLLTSIQFAFATVCIMVYKLLGYEGIDDLEWKNVKPYMYYVAGFVLGIYANMRALASSNVETVVVFRTCVPLFVSVLDWLFLGRELPSLRSCCALILICAGTLGYVSTDKQFEVFGVRGYTWVIIYFFALSFTFTYGKHVISSVDMANPVWGSVYYTNVLSIIPMLLLGFGVFNEADKFGTFELEPQGILVILVTCIVGVAISYAGMECRNLLSATAFTVVGVLNKMATVLVNTAIWDKHASPQGIFFLFVCVVGGSFYKQAPLRSNAREKSISFA